ncbi:MAG: GntR family transcriptional regulator, partial [Chloroflexia bacterium]|nr:GntR family transcriptional regulator [Chloroflexia bacterium]
MPDYSGAPPRAPLARRAGWPLYRQIAADLRRQIEDGELRPGDPVPSEQALVERFGVSRGTVRQARATLRADGTIGGSQGKPLAVHGATLTQPLGELISFSAWVRSLGKQPSGRVLHLSAAPAAADLAEQVGVAAGGTVYHLERLRLADDEPLMMERTCFPEAIGRLLVGIDLDRESVYAALAACGIVVASARHRIDAIAADAEDAALLGV